MNKDWQLASILSAVGLGTCICWKLLDSNSGFAPRTQHGQIIVFCLMSFLSALLFVTSWWLWFTRRKPAYLLGIVVGSLALYEMLQLIS